MSGKGCLLVLAGWPLAMVGSLFFVVFVAIGSMAGGFGDGGGPGLGMLTGELLWPVHSPIITSSFGERTKPDDGSDTAEEFHWGVDIGEPAGNPVHAAHDAMVHLAGRAGNYGLLVVLIRDDGLQTWYGHLSEIVVQAKQRVTAGEIIGRVGSTGRSTGAHLHFEVRPHGGRPVDPMQYWASPSSLQVVEKLRPYAASAAEMLGVPEAYSAVVLVHWAQESGLESPNWIGRNGAGYNYAGIRSGNQWRSYSSLEEFTADYVDVLQTTVVSGNPAYADVLQLMRQGAPISAVLDALGRSSWDEDHYGRGDGLPDGTYLHRRYQELAPWL